MKAISRNVEVAASAETLGLIFTNKAFAYKCFKRLSNVIKNNDTGLSYKWYIDILLLNRFNRLLFYLFISTTWQTIE